MTTKFIRKPEQSVRSAHSTFHKIKQGQKIICINAFRNACWNSHFRPYLTATRSLASAVAPFSLIFIPDEPRMIILQYLIGLERRSPQL